MSNTIYYVWFWLLIQLGNAQKPGDNEMLPLMVMRGETVILKCEDNYNKARIYNWLNITGNMKETEIYTEYQLKLIIHHDHPKIMNLFCRIATGFGRITRFFIIRVIESAKELNDKLNCSPKYGVCFVKPFVTTTINLDIKRRGNILLDCRIMKLHNVSRSLNSEKYSWFKMKSSIDITPFYRKILHEYMRYNELLLNSRLNMLLNGTLVANIDSMPEYNFPPLKYQNTPLITPVNKWPQVVLLYMGYEPYRGSFDCFYPNLKLRRSFNINWPGKKISYRKGGKTVTQKARVGDFVNLEREFKEMLGRPSWARLLTDRDSDFEKEDIIVINNKKYHIMPSVLYAKSPRKKTYNIISYDKYSVVPGTRYRSVAQLDSLFVNPGTTKLIFFMLDNNVALQLTEYHVVVERKGMDRYVEDLSKDKGDEQKQKNSINNTNKRTVNFALFISIPVSIFVFCLFSLIICCVYRKVKRDKYLAKSRTPHALPVTNQINYNSHTNASSSYNTPHTLPSNNKYNSYHHSSHSGSFPGNQNSLANGSSSIAMQPMLPANLTTTTIAPVTSSFATVSTGYYPSPRPPQTTPYDSDSTPSPPPPTSILDSSTNPSITNQHIGAPHIYPALLYSSSSQSRSSKNAPLTASIASVSVNQNLMFTA